MPATRKTSLMVWEQIRRNQGIKQSLERLKSRYPDEYPLAPDIPQRMKWDGTAQKARLAMLAAQGISSEYISQQQRVNDPSIFQGNIENYIGLAQIPIGLVGPLRINGIYATGDFYVPLATIEGALIASYNRGAKVISHSGGVRTVCLTEKVSRAPGFAFRDICEAGLFAAWCVGAFAALKQVARRTTQHGRLVDIKITLEGNHVYLDCEYTTGDAAGQNLVTIATEAICQYIIKHTPVKPRHWFVESNLSGDKKATVASYLTVRGKKVVAEIVIPKRILTKFLHTTPAMMMEYWKMSFVGGVQSGSIGVQGHYANGLAALFIACGQDAACVAEAATGITRMDLMPRQDLYISVSLPNLIVGTVGGGTGLPTQRECLSMMDCWGEGRARKFAEICAAVVLAGEISIMGALAAGQFAQAHRSYGRKRKDQGERISHDHARSST
jgi:hydroxymethylglutaryl-CoA reductase (NADPH)